MTWGQWFLQILGVVSDAITSFLGMLPNPDPFPEIIAGLEVDAVDIGRVAWYWLDSFVETEFYFSLMTAFFEMFAVGWVIMMLWSWLKAR